MGTYSVIVTGGGGYFGQLLVAALQADGHKVTSLYRRTDSFEAPKGVLSFEVDLATGSGLEEVFSAVDHVDAVVNCAAISAPAACEQNPGTARAVNIPTKLVEALERYRENTGGKPLLIQMSTDQVYEGNRPWWKEDDETRPINVYGQSKLDAEELIQQRWENHAILRCSLIYGPEPPQHVGRTLFIQFVAEALRKQQPTTFFRDEFRCAVFSGDIIRTMKILLGRSDLPVRIFNMGGPERLSRVDMAKRVAEAWGLDPRYIVPAESASVKRNVASPQDISMDISRLRQVLDLEPLHMERALQDFSG
eukprot:jgi/Botrbrau1/13516/Bobra.0347s0003.1